MSIVDKLKSYIGVKNWLDKQNYQYNKEKDLNTLFLDFAKDMTWLKHFSKENSKNYKGSNKPFIYNGWIVSCNFQEFKKWYNLKNKCHETV